MPEGLDCMKTSLCPLFRHLCHRCLHTNMQPHVHTVCVSIYGMCANIYGMCMVEAIYVICHICGIFLTSPYIYIVCQTGTYIYTALLLKNFFPHAVMEVFLKNE